MHPLFFSPGMPLKKQFSRFFLVAFLVAGIAYFVCCQLPIFVTGGTGHEAESLLYPYQYVLLFCAAYALLATQASLVRGGRWIRLLKSFYVVLGGVLFGCVASGVLFKLHFIADGLNKNGILVELLYSVPHGLMFGFFFIVHTSPHNVLFFLFSVVGTYRVFRRLETGESDKEPKSGEGRLQNAYGL